MNDIMKKDLERIEETEREIAILQENRRILLGGFAQDHAPYKDGDITDTSGYSHRGKRCRVNTVSLKKRWSDKWEWEIKATVLKKDGSESLNTCDWDQDI